MSSLASHGIVVIAPEHRDGSGCASYVRAVPLPSSSSTTSSGSKHKSWFGAASAKERQGKLVAYQSYPHERTPEVETGRNNMLRIRLWELGHVHSSLLALESGKRLTNLVDPVEGHKLTDMFAGKIDVLTPSAITWAGHSFGATTITQLLKSVHYASQRGNSTTLFVPRDGAALTRQITPRSQTVLLDMWVFPLSFDQTRWLNDRPFPAYDRSKATHGEARGGRDILAIASQQFFNWKEHLILTRCVLSHDPAKAALQGTPQSDCPSRASSEGQASIQPDVETGMIDSFLDPLYFYTTASAHLSQSDYGVLFPWLCKKAFNADEGERVMRLNISAILQFLRDGGKTTLQGGVEIDPDHTSTDGRDTSDQDILGSTTQLRGWNRLSIRPAKDEQEP